MLSSQISMIDREWIELMKEAKELGLTIEDVKSFFVKHSMKQV